MASELTPNDLKGPDVAPQPAIFIVSATAPPAITVANAYVANFNFLNFENIFFLQVILFKKSYS